MILQGPRLSQLTSERVRRSSSASDANDLSRLAERALQVAAKRNASIVTAESCTAGKLAALHGCQTLRSPHKGKSTTKQVKVGRSLAADRRSKSKTVVKKGEGDRGDQRRAGSK